MSKFDKKIQKGVSQIGDYRFAIAMVIGGLSVNLSVNLNHLKTNNNYYF